MKRAMALHHRIRHEIHLQRGEEAVSQLQRILLAGVFDVVLIRGVMLMIAIVIMTMMVMIRFAISVTDILRSEAMRLGGQMNRHVDQIGNKQRQGEQAGNDSGILPVV